MAFADSVLPLSLLVTKQKLYNLNITSSLQLKHLKKSTLLSFLLTIAVFRYNDVQKVLTLASTGAWWQAVVISWIEILRISWPQRNSYPLFSKRKAVAYVRIHSVPINIFLKSKFGRNGSQQIKEIIIQMWVQVVVVATGKTSPDRLRCSSFNFRPLPEQLFVRISFEGMQTFATPSTLQVYSGL